MKKEKSMVQQGSYIPIEVAKFLQQKASERYPEISPGRLTSEILSQWAIDNGMMLNKKER